MFGIAQSGKSVTSEYSIELHALQSGYGFRKSATILANHHCHPRSGPPESAYIISRNL